MSISISLIISNLPPKEAQSIASALVTERLAACVTLTPVQSVYRWAGEICTDEEVTLTAKVSTSIIDRCVERLKNLHPYELPEIIVMPVDPERSLPAYLQWVTRECQP